MKFTLQMLTKRN